MKIFKYLFFLLLIIIIAGSIYIATKDGNYHIKETEMINAPRELVFKEVDELKNWENWEPWSEDSEDMIVEYAEKTSGEGASYSWKSEDSGDGEIQTIASKPFSEIDQKLIFKTPFGESVSDVHWRFEEMEDSTRVSWEMKGKQSFMEKLAFSFMDGSITEMLRPKFKQGLEQLGNSVTRKMEVYSINVDGITQHGGGYYMYTTTASRRIQVREKANTMLEDVERFMEENNIEKSGNPFILYNEINSNAGTAIFSAGIFTAAEVITPRDSEILNAYMPNQRALRVSLKGDYKNIEEAWETAYSYMNENDIRAAEDSRPFEVLLNNADREVNPAKWITHLYIPVE